MKVLYGKEYIHIDAHSHLRIRISMLRYTYIYLAIFCFELERILKISPCAGDLKNTPLNPDFRI